MMATDIGVEYSTQTPFGCATPRSVATGNIAMPYCYGTRSDFVSQLYWRASGSRSDYADLNRWQAVGLRVDQAEAGVYPLNARLGLVLERVAIGGPISGCGAAPVPSSGQLWPIAG
jgi:hypothetical protein